MPTIDVRINTMYPPGTIGGTRAFASATIDQSLAIRGIRVVEGKEGLFVSMPSQKTKSGEYKEICFPVTREFREQLQGSVLSAYEQAMSQSQSAQAQNQEVPGQQMGSI